jgi:hypothetical protein
MKNFALIGMISAIMLLSISELFAQDDVANAVPIKMKKSYWFDLGLGWGGQGNAFDLGFSYEVTPNRLMSFHYSGVATNDCCEEVAFFIPIENPIGKSAETVEVSYGILRKGKISLFTISAGLSYVNVETAGGSGPVASGVPVLYYTTCPANYSAENEGTMGLALRAQYIPSWRWGGLGVSPYLNLNPKYTFGSVTINLAFGRMRPRNVKV